MLKKIFILIFFIILESILVFNIFNYKRDVLKAEIINNKIIEVNRKYQIEEYINLDNNDNIIKFDSLGEHEITLIKKIDDTIIEKKLNIIVVDSISPYIKYKKTITTYIGDKINLLKNVKATDNYDKELEIEVIGNYDLTKTGTYKLKYRCSDTSGNTKEEFFDLIVKAKSIVKQSKYYIKVNKTLNVLMVYELDQYNEYTKLVKTFVVSAGVNTPTGVFTTDLKYETLSLVGGVYGHYTVRFLKSRGMWFHSVPYFSKPKEGHWDDLEYEEYNKLGTLASLGCIRLAVIDAKWIYDNISKGTKVEIYESDILPVGVVKPIPIFIDVDSPNRGWDPTDPDPENPWHN